MKPLVISKNNLFSYFLVFGYLFGVLLYDFLKIDFADELMAFFTLLFAGIMVIERRSYSQLKPLLYVLATFIFYTIYSFAVKSNKPIAILTDLVIQIKPFLCFFGTMIIAPKLNKNQRFAISIICIFVSALLLLIAVNGINSIYITFGHPSRFATATTITALLFFYCSSFSKNDVIIFIVMLLVSIFSGRSKSYGFVAIAVLLTLYVKCGGQLKINIKNLIIGLAVMVIAVALSWQKITLYYIDGAMNSQEVWSRPAMIITMFLLFADYFPFGTGLASFGTYASGEYYSSIYEEYGLSHLWGLSEKMPSFICDAFYPELAQFGIIGVVLYFYFWWWVIKRGMSTGNKKNKLIVILVFTFFLVEGVADCTFVQNRGLFMLIILGCVMSDRGSNKEVKPSLPDNEIK